MSEGFHHPFRQRPWGVTIAELLIALALFSVLSGVAWSLFSNFASQDSKLSVTRGASLTLVQQQSRQAIRKLFYRLQEGIEIIEPPPGKTDSNLQFRDLLNRTVRLRHDQARRELVSERLAEGVFVDERSLPTTHLMVQPIRLDHCSHITFTTLTPTTLFVSFSTSDQAHGDSFMSIVHLPNSQLTQ